MAQDPLERLKRLLGEMQLEVERLSRRLYAVGERLDDLAFQLSECVKKPALLLNPASVGQVLANVKEENSLDKALLVLKAERGVQRVVVFPRPGGGFKALVDGQYEVELSGQTGLLLELLIAPGGRIEDQFVGWKTVAEICKALGEKAGRPVTRENLDTIVWRLREELSAAGLPRELVRRHPRKGLRLALLRSCHGSAADDPALPGTPA